MHTGRPLNSSLTVGLGTMALALVGSPWWLTAIAFGCFALALVVAAVQSVFPQESAHRLAWWRDRRRHHHLRRQTSAPTGYRGPAGVTGDPVIRPSVRDQLPTGLPLLRRAQTAACTSPTCPVLTPGHMSPDRVIGDQ